MNASSGATLPPDMDPAEVSRAVVDWTGYGTTSWPVRDPARVQAAHGERATDLLPVVRALADDFDRSDARHELADLDAIGRRAADEFRARHPELSTKAVDALRWCHTWDQR